MVDLQRPGLLKLAANLLTVAAFSTTLAAESASLLVAAHEALEQGRADVALNTLIENNSAEAHNLRCRVYFQEQKWEQAVKECEQAVHTDGSSINHLWLGRAYGEKAERAGIFSAYSLGKGVRQEFEAATKTDPKNAEAFADLGEFYSSAPGIVGGGRDKAESVVRTLETLDRTRSHELEAHIAEGQKDYPRAESELKAAILASRKPADAWMTLASFYRHHERWDEMVATVRSGFHADNERSSALVTGAQILTRANREPKLALTLLEAYLGSQHKSEDAPTFEVYVEIARLKQNSGDITGAIEALKQSLALAHDYQPALDTKSKLEGK